MKSKFIPVALFLAATFPSMTAFSAAADSRNPESAPADSVAIAIATIWADYMQPQLKTGGDAYKKGILESFGLPEGEQDYYKGIYEGMAIKNQLRQMEHFGYQIDWPTLTATLSRIFEGGSTPFTPATADAFLSSFMAPSTASSGEKALSPESQKEFIAAQAAEPGAVTTPSGLVFQIITEGEGEMPAISDRVRIRYTGRLSDGTVFDITEGEPPVMSPGSLIPGFAEGLTMMRPGGTYRIIIPPELAYGDRGAGKVIPPGAALDFTVELIDIIRPL